MLCWLKLLDHGIEIGGKLEKAYASKEYDGLPFLLISIVVLIGVCAHDPEPYWWLVLNLGHAYLYPA